MLSFPLKDFILDIFIVYWFTIKFVLRLSLSFSQISFDFSNNSSSFIKKRINLVSSKSFLCAVIFGRNIHKGQIFLAFFSLLPMKYLNPFLPKET